MTDGKITVGGHVTGTTGIVARP